MFRRFRFFTKLFIAFLLTGIIPVALISILFAFLSGNIMKGSYRQQSQIVVNRISQDLSEQFEKYRHTVYQMSSDSKIINAIERDEQPDRQQLLFLYQKMYQALTGNIDNASLHIISLSSFPSISTQLVPESYIEADSDTAGGIFGLARLKPEKTFLRFNSFINGRGDAVMLTFCRAVRNAEDEVIGFIVLDINKNHIAETAEKGNQEFFSQLLVVDPLNNKVVDLNHDENDGNFSRLPFLAEIPTDYPGLYTKGDRMIVHQPLELTPFQIAGSVPMNVVLSNLAYLTRITLLMFILSLFLAVLLAYTISRSISGPVHRLSLAMGKVEEGDLSVRIDSDRSDEIGLLYKRFNIMTSRIGSLVSETKEEQKQLRIAERKALQAQINPHFLYNTLNTIKSIAKLEGVDQITTIATEFGKLLRSAIDNNRDTVTLKESLDLVESYLVIQKIRYGQRLSFEIRSDSDLYELPIPKLIIQPVVENAVIHGLEQKVEPGRVEIEVRKVSESLLIEVKDDGLGLSEGKFRDESCGVGLSNVKKRLFLTYGEACSLTIENREDIRGTRVLISIPLEEGNTL